MYLSKWLFVLMLMCCMLSTPGLAADAADNQGNVPTGTLAGQFRKNSKTPLAGGRLFIYNKAMGTPSADRYVRVPDQIAELDTEGNFLLQLPAGTYYLSAINAPAGTPMGPPPEGELVYYRINTRKEIQPFNVRNGEKTDVGVISSPHPYKRGHQGREDTGATVIKGAVIDENGAPVEGAVILAHLRPGIQDMAAYVSERTAKDGKFVLRVNDGGTYYLRARSEYHGGVPNAGEFVNFSDPKDQVVISLKKGEKFTDVIVKVKRQPEKGPLGLGKSQ